MSITTRVADKAGVIGTIAGSFGCAACFPAAASIGAAIGLGFLGQWEGLFVRILIPIFSPSSLCSRTWPAGFHTASGSEPCPGPSALFWRWSAHSA